MRLFKDSSKPINIHPVFTPNIVPKLVVLSGMRPPTRAVDGRGGRSTASWTPREVLLLIGLCVSVALNCLVAAVLLTEPSPAYLIAPPASPPPSPQPTNFDSLHTVLNLLKMSEYAPNLVDAGVSRPKRPQPMRPTHHVPLPACLCRPTDYVCPTHYVPLPPYPLRACAFAGAA